MCLFFFSILVSSGLGPEITSIAAAALIALVVDGLCAWMIFDVLFVSRSRVISTPLEQALAQSSVNRARASVET